MFCPDMAAGRGVVQLGRYSHAVSGPSHAAFDDVANPELLRDPPDVNVPALVAER